MRTYCTGTTGLLLSAFGAHLESFLAVETLHQFVIDLPALAAQEDVQTAVAVAHMNAGETQGAVCAAHLGSGPGPK